MGTGGSPLTAALSIAAEIAGIAAIVAGFAVIAPWAGLIVGGIALIVVGMAIDPPRRTPPGVADR